MLANVKRTWKEVGKNLYPRVTENEISLKTSRWSWHMGVVGLVKEIPKPVVCQEEILIPSFIL